MLFALPGPNKHHHETGEPAIAQDEHTQPNGLTADIVMRLGHRAWLLAAAAILLLAAAIFGALSLSEAAALGFGLLVIGALVPERHEKHRDESVGNTQPSSQIGGLSATRLAAAVPDPLILFDRQGVIVHANAAAERAFAGVDAGIDVQLRFRAPEMQRLIQATIAAEPGAGEGVDYSDRTPIERLYRVSASAIGDGSDLHVLVFKDQSEIRRIDRMRADFIANASHELRTPLATISGFVETLQGPARDDPKARDRFLGIMQSQTQRMARLIDDLLSLSRIEMKSTISPDEKVDLKRMVGAVADALNQLATESGVTVERHFAEGDVIVPGSEDELFQVFENLIENACKYGQSGGRVVLTIEKDVDAARPVAEVTVRDFGPGISDEHIPRITERFYRVDVENSRAQKGTGLGLAIVKHILTRHNARLAITSRLGQGASFKVTLPLS